MKQPRIVIEGENDREFTNFDFVIADCNGVYPIDSEIMGVLINGVDFILEFNGELMEEIRKNISIKNLMNRN